MDQTGNVLHLGAFCQMSISSVLNVFLHIKV